MTFSIITESSAWFILACIFAGLAYAFILYRKNTTYNEIASWKVKMMFTLRFLSVTLISFFLLSPLIRTNFKFVEKPIIILAQDNSESVVNNKYSAYYKSNYQTKFKNLVEKLSDNYDVKIFTFGDKISDKNNINFDEKRSDFSQLFSEIEAKFANRNVGALVVASDGLYNSGINPNYLTKDIDFPIYTVAMGDTAKQKDIFLSDLKYNNIAFVGNKSPLQIYFRAVDLKGKSSNLKVFHGKNQIFTKEIKISNSDYTEIIDLEIENNAVGLQHFHIKTSTDKSELNTKNNNREIVIDVIDNRQKILILYNSVHPDVGAISNALSMNLNLETEVFSADNFDKKLSDYNLIILHQLPSETNSANNILKEIFEKRIPAMFILGGQSSFNQINNLKTGFSIRNVKSKFDEAQAIVNNKFTFFEVSPELKEFVENASPLLIPYGDYKVSSTSSVLLNQKVKNIENGKPLMFFDTYLNNKIAFIAGEGIWRWEMFNYREYKSKDLFNQLINKFVQYLAIKVNKQNFQVTVNKIFAENEPIIFQAETYNQSFELINKEDVSLEITNKNGVKYDFTFSKTANAYYLNVGNFASGDYSYVAKTKEGEKISSFKGNFTVLPLNIEAEKSVADHNILYNLATNNKGKMINANEIEKIENIIKNNENIVSIEFSEKQLNDFINLKFVFFLLLVLLSSEWFFRKYFGGY
jgi:hypothetical protein